MFNHFFFHLLCEKKKNFFFFFFFYLFRKDVNKLKVDAALENAEFHNVGSTVLVGHNLDATKNWNKIVEMA
jgi:hypothetical protein